MPHHCVLPRCTKNSLTHPRLSFHSLPLRNKALLKVWIHRIGRKNLPLNSNSRVCSDHFVNSVGRNLRKDDFPSVHLPILPTTVTYKQQRKPPVERYSCSSSENFTDFETNSVQVDVATVSMSSCASVNTDLTGNDIQLLKAEIVKLKDEVKCLRQKVQSTKFCLSNIAAHKVSYYTGYPSVESLMDVMTFWVLLSIA